MPTLSVHNNIFKVTLPRICSPTIIEENLSPYPFSQPGYENLVLPQELGLNGGFAERLFGLVLGGNRVPLFLTMFYGLW